MSSSRRNARIVIGGIDLISRGLIHELNSNISTTGRGRAQRRWWVKPWVSRRDNLRATTTEIRLNGTEMNGPFVYIFHRAFILDESSVRGMTLS